VDELAKELPLGYRVVKAGQATQLGDTMSSLGFALLLGILVAYMVLASQFASFLHPVTVLTILPLALAGGAFALLATGKTLNMFSMIGVLLLMGIVKKNSILIVEYTNHVREADHKNAHDSLMVAGPLRLRPILMTTFATMMGAVPAVLGLGSGSETRGPMAVVVLGGLTLSTALSLLVVPAFYLVTDRMKARLMPGSVQPRSSAAPPAPPVPPAEPPPGSTPPTPAPTSSRVAVERLGR
jgi:multidrug efflux pump subunit AcrB